MYSLKHTLSSGSHHEQQSNVLKYLLLVTMSAVTVACQPDGITTPNGESSEIGDVRVQVSEPTRATIKVEQFPLPNCGGTDRLAQSLGTYASATKSATVGEKASVTGGGEVAIPETTKLKLEIQVELSYQQSFESANSRLDTIEMAAAAGTHVVYTIVWEEQTFDSVVQYSSDGKVYRAPYVYRLSVPKIDTSYEVACLGNATTSNAQPTFTPSVQVGNSTSRPSFVHVLNGTDYTLSKDWAWVCTGDFSTKVNGVQEARYDIGVSNTGSILVLSPNSNFTISGPFDMATGVDVGDCYPYTQNEKDTGISNAIQTQLNMGCGSKCMFVNVIELDKDGNQLNNYWTPRQP